MPETTLQTWPEIDPLMLAYYEEVYSVDEKGEFYPNVWQLMIDAFESAGRTCMADKCRQKMNYYASIYQIERAQIFAGEPAFEK